MAASQPVSNVGVLSKAEYLKRYLGEDDCRKSKENKTKKKRIKPHEKGMKIVDDDIDWKQLVNTEEKENHEEDEEEAPVVAEFIDERPEEIKRLEEFRTSNKWRVMGGKRRKTQRQTKKASPRLRHDSPDAPATKSFRHDSPDLLPVRKGRHDSPVKKSRHDSPDLSPVRNCHDSPPDLSPKRKNADLRKEHPGSRPSFPAQRKHSSSPSTFLKKQKGSSPSRRKHQFGKRRDSDSDLSPQRRVSSSSPTSDLSPPRKRPHQKNRGSDSDLSPPRRSRNAGRNSDSDLSPPRRVLHRSPDAQKMLSGGAAGLVSVEVLKREKEEKRKRDKKNQPLEDESHNAKTVFRDKSGRRRDIEQEREEQRKRAGEQAEKDKKYAQWGKGLAQAQMQEQNVKDAIKEAQKPLARYADDEDLDKMLREQEREGDPMAEMLRKKKEKDSQRKGVKEMPRYKGPPPPPNRFNIMPGYRWDGVDRSNGFEKQRYSRLADKKAVQEMAYKWSVEDM
ncbi:hypothetical protein GN956_G3204 [Arapaima gigas]